MHNVCDFLKTKNNLVYIILMILNKILKLTDLHNKCTLVYNVSREISKPIVKCTFLCKPTQNDIISLHNTDDF